MTDTDERSTSDRYSFKIKFDKYTEDQTWLGLDKLVLNSNFSDATAIMELKKLGKLRADSIQGQLDGRISSTTEAQNAEPDKLLDASSVNLSALGSQVGGGGHSPGSSMGSPGGGSQDGILKPEKDDTPSGTNRNSSP